jgi:apolipoprotein N-acyltransferase
MALREALRLAALAAAGALAALAMPPWQLWLLLAPAFAVLAFATEGMRPAAAARAGWAFGAGFFALGIGWIGESFTVDAERFGAVAPFAVAALAAGLALFPALATALAATARARGLAHAVALAGAWTLIEMLRGWVLTGFPWNLIGSTWVISDRTMQAAAFAGPFGLGLATVLAAASAAEAVRRTAAPARRLAALMALPGLAAALWIVGAARLPDGPAPETATRLRVVQPNVPQALKWDPAERRRIIGGLLALSQGGVPADVLIWPESAAPVLLQDAPGLARAIGATLPPQGIALVGAVRRDAQDRPFNSVVALDAAGEWIATYDKARLVPFGEYVPLPQLFRLSKLTEGRGDFVAGPGPVTLTLGAAPPVQPLICYEANFPGFAPAAHPEWMAALTNDAWFGSSAGPWQHLAAARLRAVERGLPMARAANTGVSAVIDPYGRIVASLAIETRGRIDGLLPAPLAPTFYARFGDWPVGALAVLMLVAAAVASRRGARAKDASEITLR